MTNIPEGHLYSNKHEWVKEEGDVIKIGISDYAQNSLGDIVFIDLKPSGTVLEPGDNFGTIESVKAAEDVYAPPGGTIVEINSVLNNNPAQVNKDPYGSWMVKIKDYNKQELETMMGSEAYAEYITSLEE